MKKKNCTRTNTDEHGFIDEVKKRKEFSGLPDSVVLRALRESGDDVKEARKLLRKYFGVFLTNKVLRFARSQVACRRSQDMLGFHISSKKRDYQKFYEEIFEVVRCFGASVVRIPQKSKESSNHLSSCGSLVGTNEDYVPKKNIGSIIDLGCGVNGFSYSYLRDVFGDVEYIGIEAAGQLVEKMNVFFEEGGFDGRAVCGDLFDLDLVRGVLKKARKKRVVFMFQVVDALESVERNFSLELIGEIMKNAEVLVLSVPLVSLGGGKKFAVKRKWLMDFLVENYDIVRDFEIFGERVLIVGKRV